MCLFFTSRVLLIIYLNIMFKRISGKQKPEWYPVKVSTAFSNGGLTYWNGSGYLIPADATSGDHAGVILKTIASGDDDYATARKVMIDVPNSEDVYEVSVDTGTLTVAMVGNAYDLIAAGTGLNVTAQAKKVVTVVGFISASKALVKINALATNVNVATS